MFSDCFQIVIASCEQFQAVCAGVLLLLKGYAGSGPHNHLALAFSSHFRNEKIAKFVGMPEAAHARQRDFSRKTLDGRSFFPGSLLDNNYS